MTAVDPLTQWWVHEVLVERRTGAGAYGSTFDTATPHMSFIDDRRQLVRTGDGSEAVSETTVLLPIATPDVPLGSRVTLPPSHGSRATHVLAASRHDGGGLPTPDHLELALA